MSLLLLPPYNVLNKNLLILSAIFLFSCSGHNSLKDGKYETVWDVKNKVELFLPLETAISDWVHSEVIRIPSSKGEEVIFYIFGDIAHEPSIVQKMFCGNMDKFSVLNTWKTDQFIIEKIETQCNKTILYSLIGNSEKLWIVFDSNPNNMQMLFLEKIFTSVRYKDSKTTP